MQHTPWTQIVVSKMKRKPLSRTLRKLLFFLILLAVVVTGVLALLTGITSPSTVSSGVLTLVIAIVTVIPIYPVLVPSPPDLATSAATPASATSTPGPITGPQVPQQNFFFNLPLRDPHEFYGRTAARTTLITRTYNGGSSSIVGERREGKTWLLTYLQLVAPTYSLSGSAYRVARVSATHPQCAHLAGFVRHVLDAFHVSLLSADLPLPPLSQLAREVRNLKKLGIAPILCIDEFEGFTNTQEFTSSFVEGLRALTQDDGLILVTASRRPLKELIENLTGETSPLFNTVQQISLHPFDEQEARAFVEAKSTQVGFHEEEQEYFLRWGTLYTTHGDPYWPPLRLQLVGQVLLDEKLLPAGQQAASQADKIRARLELKARLDETYHSVVRQNV